MKYRFIYFFIFILIIFNCKTNNSIKEKDSNNNSTIKEENDIKANNTKNGKKEKSNKKISKIKIEEEFYVDIIFTQNVKVNNKIVIYDMTDDVKKYLTFFKKYDNTSDLLKSGDFLYKNEDLELLEKYKNILKKSIIDNLRNEITNKSESLTVSEYNKNSNKNKYIVNVLIEDFQEGEYNLIKNLPTEIIIKANIFNEGSMKNEIYLLKKKYKQKAEINYPIEKLRLEYISTNISKDIFKIIYNKYIK